MINTNKFILICSLRKPDDRYSRKRFGNNFNSVMFAKFKNRLKLETPQLFPVGEKDKLYDNRILSEQLISVRRINKHQYVAAGCLQQGFSAAAVNANIIKVEAKCLEIPCSVFQFRGI